MCHQLWPNSGIPRARGKSWRTVWGYIEVQTPLYSLHLSAFTPFPSSLPSRTRSQALPVSQSTALTPSARLINRSQEDIEEEERKAARQLMWMIPLTVLLSAYLYKDLSEIATYVQLGTPSEIATLCARLSEIAPHVQFDEDDKNTLSEMATLCAPVCNNCIKLP